MLSTHTLQRHAPRLALVVLAFASSLAAQSETEAPAAPLPRADLLIVNARIWTGDPARPQADALAVGDGRFLLVGSRQDVEAGTYRRRAQVIDVAGRRVIPGLIDAHVHLVSGGQSLARLSLRDAKNRTEFLDAVRREAERLPAGDWLLGRGWSTESWPDPTQPTAAWIDDITGDRPTLLHRMDGHCALANTAAMRRAGITDKEPPDPPGGRIERDPATGKPTGILLDAAIELVARLVPEPSVEQQVEAALAAMREANRHGVTTVHTMSPWSDLEPLRRVHEQKRDTLRVVVYVMEPDWVAYVERIRAFPVSDDRLWIAGFKDYIDGSMGARTAYMRKPYTDRPDTRGVLMASMLTPDRMKSNLRAAQEAGLQPAIHAIGDEANHLLLNLYAEVASRGVGATSLAQQGWGTDRRPRIEHVQHLLPDDIPRFAALGVVASMQPLHKADDGRYAEAAIGATRCRTSYAFRDLLTAGATLAFGSDWPVVSINPFLGLHAAVTGRTLDGRAWMTHQNLRVEEALKAYTFGAAYACGREDRLGRITPGYLADFVILDRDPFAVAQDELVNIKPVTTFVAGHHVWPTK
jgi:predicted amidohydrolase YtcJ